SALGDHLFAGVEADLSDDAEDIALRLRGIGTADEIRAAERVEVRGVVAGKEGVVHQLAQFARRWRNGDAIDGIGSFGGGHVMGIGTDAANAGGDARQFFHRASLAEFLEAAQFRNLEVAVGKFTVVVDKEVNLAVPFQPGDRVNNYTLHTWALRSSEPARLKR